MRKTLSCGEAPLFQVILLTSDFGIAPASTFHAPRPMTTNKCGLVKVCGGFATTGPVVRYVSFNLQAASHPANGRLVDG
jgi:hypothetical protein